MKKSMKLVIIVIVLIIGIILIDSLQALVFDNNPILKIRQDYNGGNIFYIDKGLLVDTYYCSNNEKDTVFKGFSYSCSSIDDYVILDTSKDIENFVCDTALEKIYEDTKYTYYLSCIKSQFIEVRYNNNQKENIITALENNRINIEDLDKFNIEYIKYEK